MSSARNHQKRSHRSYRVTKSICGGRGEKGVGHAAVQPEAERAAGADPPPDPRPRTAHSGPQAQRASIPRRGAERSGER